MASLSLSCRSQIFSRTASISSISMSHFMREVWARRRVFISLGFRISVDSVTQVFPLLQLTTGHVAPYFNTILQPWKFNNSLKSLAQIQISSSLLGWAWPIFSGRLWLISLSYLIQDSNYKANETLAKEFYILSVEGHQFNLQTINCYIILKKKHLIIMYIHLHFQCSMRYTQYCSPSIILNMYFKLTRHYSKPFSINSSM